LSKLAGESGTQRLNKRMAHELLFELEARVSNKNE
jgi:hypothetical protein